MPELPEVETVVQQLRKTIVGKAVCHVEILDRKVVDPSVRQAVSVVRDVQRRGKYIIISLKNGRHMLIHLRMTGHFYHCSSESEAKKKPYLRAMFTLDNGKILTFNCMRRFSRVEYYSPEALERKLRTLGPDALDVDRAKFAQLLQPKAKAQIKPTLMDQHVLAGVGNIYAQEALYHAGIDPRRKIAAISAGRMQQLHQQLQRILRLSIENNGTTIRDYAHITGKGDFQHLLAVYQKEKCPKAHPLQRISVGGRGTYICSKCQR